ncbi:MAG TPA: RNA polymerase sigma factor [Blastocatellia bacterium]|nr:RNA polymerase sigma factor [Blastocatellia bacterium]HMX24534.1 RNA polymerase sigma factor [Blastocatellia bacterium]HMZ17197.1 RNA polymerase sigma factor [Blastocatellia bacterium]HNG31890.1 RNA polymerase sigma factor [Blastocatellia bacterium]
MSGETMSGEFDVAMRINQMRFNERAQETMTPEVRPFDLLVSRACKGDLTAFDQIITAHQQKVIGVAWRMLGNQDDARDAAQETFLRVYKHLHKFDPAQEFSAWLYRIAVNVCHDLARKRSRGNPVSLEEEMEAGNFAEPVSPHNTERSAMCAQERRMVARALATLPEKQRAAIILRDLEGLPTEEVARILGSTPTTVRSQISVARTKIKEFRDRWLKNPGQYRDR